MDLTRLSELVDAGEIDTVVVCFPDLQGRLMGKRVTGRYFLDHLVRDGMHACNYLFTVDMDMEPLPGFAYANWGTGFPDVRAVPDMATLRPVPWLEATVLVLCDVLEPDGTPTEVSPRRILRRQIERAAAAGFEVRCGSELEFYLFVDAYEDAAAKGYRGLVPHAEVLQDYHVLQTTRDEYLIREIRNAMDAAGVTVEFSKGEWGRGQHEINLAYTEALQMADRHVVYKNGVKEIAALRGRAITFMAKWSMDAAGSSFHLHTSLWRDGASVMWDETASDHLSEPARGFLAGLMSTARELTWMYAPTVNSYKRFQPGSWAPTAVAWDHDNRTTGFRLVGHGQSFRIENRIPGADANPYLVMAAAIAGGLHGIERGLEPPAPYRGNAYEADDLERVPWNIVEAAEAFASSAVAREAFGPDVHEHLVHAARQEWARANATVTDWELRRGFEQS